MQPNVDLLVLQPEGVVGRAEALSPALLGFLLRRLAASLLLLLLVLTFTFFFIHLLPGDPIHLVEGQRLTLEQQQRLQQIYGLDRPLPDAVPRLALARWRCMATGAPRSRSSGR